MELLELRPIETAPRDGTYILLAGPSGYRGVPLRIEVCQYDAEFRPNQPWITYAGDSFLDTGEPPTHWMPYPKIPTPKEPISEIERILWESNAEEEDKEFARYSYIFY